MRWLRQKRDQGANISHVILCQRAELFAQELGQSDWKASVGWSQRLCKRHGVKCGNIFGEAQAADFEGKEEWIQDVWPDICKNYSPGNIWNADETDLHYRMLPGKTLKFSDDMSKGGKKNKERVTALLCCSMLGEKYKPFIIGKSSKPRCFRGVDISKLVKYSPQKSSWMTSDLFGIWLKELNRKMAKEKRSILLTVDNASCHNSGIELELSNVKVQFLPKNTTSIMQPLDMGIIAATKVFYRKKMCRAMITELDKNALANARDLSKKITLLQGIEFFVEAWNEVSVATIANCWRKSGLCFGPEQQEEVVEMDIALDNEIYAQIDKEDFDRWVNCDANLLSSPSLCFYSPKLSYHPVTIIGL